MLGLLACLGGFAPEVFARVADSPVDQQPGGFHVRMEHLVIRPSGSGGFEVLDVMRLERVGPAAGPVRFTLPLVAGYEGLRVLEGLVAGSQTAGPDFLSGELAGEGGGTVTVAVAYRVGQRDRGEPWLLLRPYPVEVLILMVHPDLAVGVTGAQAAGELEVDGTPYQTYMREGLGPGAAVALTVGLRAARPGPAGVRVAALAATAAAAGIAGALAVALVGWRRRGRPELVRPGASSRIRDRLADEVLALDAEFAAGYLEEARYRQRRQEALARLARWIEATEGPAAPRAAGADAGRPGGAAT